MFAGFCGVWAARSQRHVTLSQRSLWLLARAPLRRRHLVWLSPASRRTAAARSPPCVASWALARRSSPSPAWPLGYVRPPCGPCHHGGGCRSARARQSPGSPPPPAAPSARGTFGKLTLSNSAAPPCRAGGTARACGRLRGTTIPAAEAAWFVSRPREGARLSHLVGAPQVSAGRKLAMSVTATSSLQAQASRMAKPVFPFVKITGQADMKLGLILNIIDPALGGVLIMGDRGTGKSMSVRLPAAEKSSVWSIRTPRAGTSATHTHTPRRAAGALAGRHSAHHRRGGERRLQLQPHERLRDGPGRQNKVRPAHDAPGALSLGTPCHTTAPHQQRSRSKGAGAVLSSRTKALGGFQGAPLEMQLTLSATRAPVQVPSGRDASGKGHQASGGACPSPQVLASRPSMPLGPRLCYQPPSCAHACLCGAWCRLSCRSVPRRTASAERCVNLVRERAGGLTLFVCKARRGGISDWTLEWYRTASFAHRRMRMDRLADRH